MYISLLKHELTFFFGKNKDLTIVNLFDYFLDACLEEYNLLKV